MSEQRKSMLPFYFRMAIAIAYIVLGFVVLNTDAGFIMTGSKTFGYIFGSLCLAYGLFRIYRARKNMDPPPSV